MTLAGKWENAYGSVMELTQDPGGTIFGEYSSTTGSTGKYYVYGWAMSQDPTPSLGESAALCIYWRSIKGGTGDPSWHWVSGLGGQLSISKDGTETLSLIHAMVATDAFPGLAAPGTYLDKLIYSRASTTGNVAQQPDKSKDSVGDPIEGSWICLEDPTISLTLAVVNAVYGVVQGMLSIGGGKYLAYGFTDTYAMSGGLSLQAFSVTSAMGDGKSIALAGSLNYSTKLLSVDTLESIGTPSTSTYVTTTTEHWTFRQVG